MRYDFSFLLKFVFFPKDENLGVLKSIVCMRVWVGGRCGSGCGGGMGWEAGGGVGGGDLGGARPAAISHQTAHVMYLSKYLSETR